MKTAKRHTHAITEHHQSDGHHRSTGRGFANDVAQLRDDVTGLMQSAATAGQHGVGAVRDTAAGAMDGIKERVSDISNRAAKSAKVIRKQVGAHPMTSTLIGLGVGLFIGRFFARK